MSVRLLVTAAIERRYPHHAECSGFEVRRGRIARRIVCACGTELYLSEADILDADRRAPPDEAP